ncbi:hypothetical protein [Aurantibacillus circumpalustris]|uniref:hypothetical protein n=1 Tax=Aurantibacillus circumpalustris TaxID=3036359 RepID=UPI00295B855D|nr:hypothetical protein [Aurantibacillus circumpalustris]
MKRIYSIIFLLFLTFGYYNSQTSYTWASTGSTSFSTSANWSPNGNPGPGDDIIFNGSSIINCDFDIDVDVTNISINAGYTGLVNGLAGSHVFRGDFSQSVGTFSASSSNIGISGSMSFTGGTFDHNGGLITLKVNDLVVTTIAGSIAFNDLSINDRGVGVPQRTVDFGTNTTVNNLILNGGSERFGYLGSVNILSSLVIGGTNTGNPSPNSGTFTFSGAGPISITGATNATRNKLPNLVFNTSGNISITGNVNVQGNWTGTQGILTAGSSIVNMYGSSATINGTAAAFNDLTIQTGASVTMPASEVKIGGSLTRTGTLTFQSTSSLGFNGAGAQSVSLGGITLAGITAYNTGGTRAVTLSGSINVLDSIKAELNTTLNTGGSLTLKSNSSLTARVAESNGTISGSATVETFIPGGATGWANLGVRGVNSQSVANWDTHSSSGGLNGIPMTCSLCSFPSDALGPWFNSIQSWKEFSSSYDSLTVNSPIDPGIGYWVYVGDGQTTTNDLTLINTGSIKQGPVSVSVTAAGSGADQGFNLIANPYPSPISISKFYAFGLNPLDFGGTISIWNANIGTFVDYNTTGVSNPGGFNNDVIMGGQAFYIEYTGGSGGGGGLNANFTEDMKVATTGTTQLLKSSASTSLSYFRLKLAGAQDESETVISIHQNATPLFDSKFDARKILQTPGYVGYPGNYSHYTTISSKDADNRDYSINTLPPLDKTTHVPIMTRVSASGSYTINAFDFQNFSSCLVLIDKLDNSYHDLGVSPYVFTINDTTSAPRFDLVLCKDESFTPLGIKEDLINRSVFISQDAQGAFVKTSFDKNTKATISAYNIVGQKIMDDVQVEGRVTDTHLNLGIHNQVVLIRVVTDKESTTKKIVIN